MSVAYQILGEVILLWALVPILPILASVRRHRCWNALNVTTGFEACCRKWARAKLSCTAYAARSSQVDGRVRS